MGKILPQNANVTTQRTEKEPWQGKNSTGFQERGLQEHMQTDLRRSPVRWYF